jgi:hypothetical protein
MYAFFSCRYYRSIQFPTINILVYGTFIGLTQFVAKVLREPRGNLRVKFLTLF